MSFGAHGGIDLTIRKLKWWCVMPPNPESTRDDHKEYAPWSTGEEAPSDSELDAMGRAVAQTS
eukprot:7581957-Lingulodinium_polyedra.AAC.1